MDTNLEKVQKIQLEECSSDESPLDGGDWYLITDKNIQVVLDSYTYFDFPEGLEFYMDKKTLRCMIKMDNGKWSRFIDEYHLSHPDKTVLRYAHKDYVQDHIRYDKNWCFGILFKDASTDGVYTICTLKAVNNVDFMNFALFLFDKVHYTKKVVRLYEQLNIKKQLDQSV